MKYRKISCLFVVGILAQLSIGSAYAENDYNKVVDYYSKSFGVDKEEANRRLEIMSKFEVINEQLIKEFGDDIAGVFYDTDGDDFKIVVRTTKKGRTLRNIRNFAGSMEVPIEVIPNSPRNKRSIENIINNQGARLAKANPSVQSLGYNPRLDLITVFIYEPDTSKQLAFKNDKTFTKISGMDTELVFLKEPIDTLNLKGGAPMIQNNDKLIDGKPVLSYRNPCTTGFPAIYNGKAGLVTAAHCAPKEFLRGSKFKYLGYDGFTSNMTMTVYDANAKNHDMAFIQPDSPVNVTNQYYASPQGESGPIELPIGTSAVGAFVCHQGRTTGMSCGEITHVNIINNTYRGCPANLTFGVTCNPSFVAVQSIKNYPTDPL